MKRRVKEVFSRCEFANYTLPKKNQVAVMFYPWPRFDLQDIHDCFIEFKRGLPEGTRCMGLPRLISPRNLEKQDVIDIRDALTYVLEHWDEGVKHDSDSETGTGT